LVGQSLVVTKAEYDLGLVSYYKTLIGTHFDHLFYTSIDSSMHLTLFM